MTSNPHARALKRCLELEWKRRGVRFAFHLCRWNEFGPAGYKSEVTGLMFDKGKKTTPRKPRARR